jgi:hypothetical protein
MMLVLLEGSGLKRDQGNELSSTMLSPQKRLIGEGDVVKEIENFGPKG